MLRAERMITLSPAATSLATDYALSLLQAVVVLGLTAALAYLTLRFGAARGLLGSTRGKLIQVEESVRLDPKSSLVIVRIEGRRLLVSTHAQGAPRLVLELAPSAADVPVVTGREEQA